MSPLVCAQETLQAMEVEVATRRLVLETCFTQTLSNETYSRYSFTASILEGPVAFVFMFHVPCCSVMELPCILKEMQDKCFMTMRL